MTRRATIYFAVVGIAAAIVVAKPQIILIGFVLGILPGYLLALAPSLFCYSAAWYVIRAVIHTTRSLACLTPAGRAFRWAAGLLAAAIVTLPAILAPRAFNAPIDQIVTALRAQDHESGGPVALPSVIAIILPRDYTHKLNLCEALCQHLLYNGVASRVIVAETRWDGDNMVPVTPDAYWIERRDPCPEPAISDFQVFWPTDFPLEVGGPLSRVRARIAAGECLMRGSGRLDEAGATIAFRNLKNGKTVYEEPWSLGADIVDANRLEIVGSGGRVSYRRTEVTVRSLFVPLVIDVRAGFLTAVTYVGWGRSVTVFGPLGPQGRDVLPQLLGSASRRPDKVGN